MTVLTDSDILIEVTRAKDTEIISKWTHLANSDAVILYSPVSVAELWAGARPREFTSLEMLFSGLECVPIDEEIGRKAGDFIRTFGRSHSVEVADALIAASAIASHAVLWTRNRKHYPMPELSFFD